MGGGLVLFGIGGNTGGGGLLDAVGSRRRRRARARARPATELKAANTALAANPDDTDALGEKIRAAFQLAKENVNPETGAPTTSRPPTRSRPTRPGRSTSSSSPTRRTRSPPLNPGPKQPDVSLAGYMLQIYDISGLNQPAEAAKAAELVALSRPTVGAYLKLAQYSAAAGQTRTADLAAGKAVELAEPAQRKAVEKQARPTRRPARSRPPRPRRPRPRPPRMRRRPPPRRTAVSTAPAGDKPSK